MIYIKDITQDYVSGLAGLRVGEYIDKQLSDTSVPKPLNLSFKDIDMITPSFVNGAFLYLIDLYSYELFRENVKIKEIKGRVGEILKSSINSYVNHKHIIYNNLKKGRKIHFVNDNKAQNVNLYRKFYINFTKKEIEFSNSDNDNHLDSVEKDKILKSDVVIGIAVDIKEVSEMSKQFQFALDNQRNCILLCYKNKQIHIPNKLKNQIYTVYFDDENFLQEIKKINAIFQGKNKLKVQNQEKDSFHFDDISIAFIVMIILIVMLSVVVKKENETNDTTNNEEEKVPSDTIPTN